MDTAASARRDHGDHLSTTLGRVLELWRYPVKSMLGEGCRSLELNYRGVAGNRQFAVRTAEGEFGSGKTTRRFQAIAGLFGFQAVYHDGIPAVTFPTGSTLRGDDSAIHVALSTALGQPVTLAQEGDISHFDAGPVHVLTTAALAWVQTHLPDARIDARRFRPNIVIDIRGATPVEHAWCGQTLALGETVRLRFRVPTERCVMVNFAQAELPDDAQVLRWLAQAAAAQLGVYAEVVVGGQVRLGDRVQFAA